ncbi:acetate/propionate family kinase [Pedobacter gandavensis]|uniref:acetate/propionate family kinase n=1 Tax=Pedobacter gandavensis TaxID=2679963 RepID=UPI00247AF389|nr:acetate/propionate family kinase [Pedobacter gandavensis]WGQ09851.1 acetate/propionate family kinase [Pedobacter gandavensis]
MVQTNGSILALNMGTSSFKFKLFDALTKKMQCSGMAKFSGGKFLSWSVKDFAGETIDHWVLNQQDREGVVAEFIKWLKFHELEFPLVGIGHRVTQGGPIHFKPTLITEELLSDLQKYSYLAPNHLPEEIELINEFGAAFVGVKQVACFDTYFHQDMPPNARYYPLDEKYKELGLIRYGFHGLSYEFIMEKLIEQILHPAREKIIIAHLDIEASMVAVKKGISIDTTMILSPAGGLVMSTSSGDLDPGVILALMKVYGFDLSQLDELLSKSDVMLPIREIGDVQELLAQEKSNPKTKEALNLFCYQAKKAIGALAAAMGGLDTLVFTGSIGSYSSEIRARICQDLNFLGIILDQKVNSDHAEIISAEKSWVTVCVFESDEEQIIAQHTHNLLNLGI